MNDLIITDVLHHRIDACHERSPNRWSAWRIEHGLLQPDWHQCNRTINLLEIRTASGLSGWQFAGGSEHCARRGSDLLGGNSAWEHERLWQLLRNDAQLSDLQVGMLDCALWDLIGRALGKPVHKLLGGARERIPAYASTPMDVGTPDDYADHAAACQAAGYTAYKIHPYTHIDPGTWRTVDGYDPTTGRMHKGMACRGFPDADLEICEAVRKRVGPDMKLMLDPHGRYESYDFATVLRVAERLAELDFTWFEVPIDEARIDDYACLTAAGILPIVGPEWSQGGVETRACWIAAGASNISRCDVAHQGITGTVRCQQLAAAHGIRCEIHRGGWDNVQVVAAVDDRVTAYYERFVHNPDNAAESACPILFGDALADTLHVDGTISAPSGPGLGFDVTSDRFQEALVCASSC